jgi:transposase
LRSLTCSDRWQHERFGRLLEHYAFLSEQIKAQTALVHELAGNPLYAEDLRILRTLGGVGVLTAMEVLLELPPMAQFARAEELAAYVGLTPAQYSSGEHIHMGRITGAGRGHLRATLIELAWRVIAKDPPMRNVYERIKQRAGSKRAIVAVARRLLLCMRRMLLDRQPYHMKQAA